MGYNLIISSLASYNILTDSTPATFETPESRGGNTPKTGRGQAEHGSSGDQEEDPTHNPEPAKKGT